MMPLGRFVITWASFGQDGDDYGIYGQLYDSSGMTLGAEFRVNTEITGTQMTNSVSDLADGGFVVTWQSKGQDGGNTYGIYGQRYGSDGIAKGNT